MIVWSATAELYKYVIEWKNGEFITSTLDIDSKELNHSSTRNIYEVLSWVSHRTDEDILDMPE